MAEKVLDTDAIMGDLKIIDGDSHFSEPPDLWTSRAPATYKDRMPRWEKMNGQTVWTIDGKYWCGIGGSTINKNMEKVLGTLSLPVEDIADDAWTVKGRLDIMDQQGVYAEVLFPNSIGFASNAVMSIDDVEFRNVVSRVYNDGMLDAQIESGERLLPQAILPV